MNNLAQSLMTIAGLPLRAAQDSTAAGIKTAYDSVWATQVPVASPSPLESIMLAQDKIYVVLAVVLIIWLGIVLMLLRTDRKIRALERRVTEDGSQTSAADNVGD